MADVMTPSMARAHEALDAMGVAAGPLDQRLAAEASAHASLDELGIEPGPLPERLAAAVEAASRIDPAFRADTPAVEAVEP